MRYLLGVLFATILLLADHLHAGLSIEVEERLLKIQVTACEVATPESLSRVLKQNLEYDIGVPPEGVPRGLLIRAEVSHIRRVWWHQLASMMLGRDEPPRVSEWQSLQPRLKSDFFYISRVATCGPLLKRRTWFVSSANNDECDTIPPMGMCVFDDQKLITYVPEGSRIFLQDAP
jgi:hypothetical protein